MNITVRLTEDEKADLTAKAKDTLGQDATLSDYVRTRLFENDQAAAIREANRRIVLAIQEGCAPLPDIEAKITSLAAYAEDQGQPPAKRTVSTLRWPGNLVTTRPKTRWLKPRVAS
jgi:hypothetical protein